MATVGQPIRSATVCAIELRMRDDRPVYPEWPSDRQETARFHGATTTAKLPVCQQAVVNLCRGRIAFAEQLIAVLVGQ